MFRAAHLVYGQRALREGYFVLVLRPLEAGTQLYQHGAEPVSSIRREG